MISERVSFYSSGRRLAGIWRTGGGDRQKQPAVVQGPGWLGLKDAQMYEPYHRALAAAGVSVLIFDYAGFGDSEGDTGDISLRQQVLDLRSAIAYASTRDDVLSGAIGVLGSGGTGGGNAIVVAATEQRVRAVVAQFPVADGSQWLRGMRSETEWRQLLRSLDDNRANSAISGEQMLVDPRVEITPPTSERVTSKVKADVDRKTPSRIPLTVAEELIDYRPIDYAARLDRPLLTIYVEDDDVTPASHALSIHAAAVGPKRLIKLRNTTHYESYRRYSSFVAEHISAWFSRHLRPLDVVIENDEASHIEYVEET